MKICKPVTITGRFLRIVHSIPSPSFDQMRVLFPYNWTSDIVYNPVDLLTFTGPPESIDFTDPVTTPVLVCGVSSPVFYTEWHIFPDETVWTKSTDFYPYSFTSNHPANDSWIKWCRDHDVSQIIPAYARNAYILKRSNMGEVHRECVEEAMRLALAG